MPALIPFSQPTPLILLADVSPQGSLWTFKYQLQIQSPLRSVPEESRTWTKEQISREDQLWSTTCFEAFFKPRGHESYFEFNFSLKPAWNLYEFNSYRNPQPPKTSLAFSLQEMSWDSRTHSFLIQILNHSKYQEFDVGLTAIIEDPRSHKHYFALKHGGEKPDFHQSESFLLQRGTKT